MKHRRRGPHNAYLPTFAVLALAALLPSRALAQQPPAGSNPAAPVPVPGGTRPDVNAALNNGVSKDRLFFALPNFLTLEDVGKVPPLTAKQKFRVVLLSSFDWAEYPWYGALAGISQWENSEAGYGQGAEGYAKRYGAYFADGTIENFMTGAILPSLLHEDPRFYQESHGTFVHRVGYAVSRIFITRNDRGAGEFNYSEIFGSALSAGISTYSYHPRDERTFANTASVWGTQVGYDTLTLVIKEFWPDIRRLLTHRGPHASH